MNRRAAVLVIGITVTMGACGRPTSAGVGTATSAPAPPAVACRTGVPGVEVSSWREVAAEGFTFCVPSDWRGGGRTWRRGSAEITWGKGTRPRQQVAVVTETVIVPAGAVPRPPSGPPPDSDLQRFTEEIGGHRATVWRNRFGQVYHTGADWESLRVWIVGEAADPASADVQVTVFRTVRFSEPPSREMW